MKLMHRGFLEFKEWKKRHDCNLAIMKKNLWNCENKIRKIFGIMKSLITKLCNRWYYICREDCNHSYCINRSNYSRRVNRVINEISIPCLYMLWKLN